MGGNGWFPEVKCRFSYVLMGKTSNPEGCPIVQPHPQCLTVKFLHFKTHLSSLACMTFTWKPSTKCLECSDLQPAINFPDMKLLTRYNLPLSEQTASCPRVCFFPPCNERQASHYVRSCNARLPDWNVSSSAFRSFTSSSAVRFLFFNWACTCSMRSQTKLTDVGVMCSSFFQSNQHNKKPSASLLQAASPG